jgi:hypothetical protein
LSSVTTIKPFEGKFFEDYKRLPAENKKMRLTAWLDVVDR